MPTTDRAPGPAATLRTSAGAPVPLTGVTVEADVSALCARVTVTQRYVNREPGPIEAVYVFPLEEGAAVCGFEALVDGTLVVGEVQERDAAFRAYDEAIEKGHGAYLLDEERPDIFQASLGNIPPGTDVIVRLTYVSELALEGGDIRFSVPTTVSPRYAPAEDRAGVGRPDAEALNPPLAWRVPYGLTFSARVAMPGPIGHIASPSHPLSVSIDGHTAAMQLTQRDAPLDRDLVVLVDGSALAAPRAWIEQDERGEGAIAVAFAPVLPEALVPADITFLVDRSGSMGGPSIREVRNALSLCLNSLTPECRFNIIGFGSEHVALFPDSRPYDDASLGEARAHVAAMEADLGGTELLPALGTALAQPQHAGLARQVVVLTDGEVTNTDAVIALAREHASSARVFTVGIGAAASHHLVRGLARAGGGAAEFIAPGERIEQKVVRLCGRLLAPALVEARIDWDGLPVTQAPAQVPPVFAGDRLLVYGLGRVTRTASVRLHVTTPSGPRVFTVPVDPARAVTGTAVATLAARTRIRELEESPGGVVRGSRQRDRLRDKAATEAVELALRHGLVSRGTSFVAIERRDAPVTGEMALRRVPIALSAGWGGLSEEHETALNLGLTVAPLAAPPVPSAAPHGILRSVFDAAARRRVSRIRAFQHADLAATPDRTGVGRPRGHAASAAPVDRLQHLVALQRADGTWDLDEALAAALGRDLAALEASLDATGAPGHATETRRAWATALALAWLEIHAPDREPEWRYLARKASRWLDACRALPRDAAAWRGAATAALTA
jgi:Ca-activated chloride channel family protein